MDKSEIIKELKKLKKIRMPDKARRRIKKELIERMDRASYESNS